MFCASYVYLFNLRWTGFTSPQPIVGRVHPSILAFYQSKGRVDGSLDEAVGVCACVCVDDSMSHGWDIIEFFAASVLGNDVTETTLSVSARVSSSDPPSFPIFAIQKT